jgi:hypothetical protein
LKWADLQRCPACKEAFEIDDFDALVIVDDDDVVRASAFRTCRDCRLERKTRRIEASRRRGVIEEALIG